MQIDNDIAERILRKEAKRAETVSLASYWARKFEEFSALCEAGVSKTHVAFLGTAILAKAVCVDADLFAIKPNHALDNPNAFSARILSEKVLVPLAAELGINLGVNGRQPLNNQPYFRMTRLDDGTPVHRGGKAAFDFMLTIIRELQELSSEREARKALRAFIAVRRRYLPVFAIRNSESSIAPADLRVAIDEFVRENSEGGKRAQAVVAGLMDQLAGTTRVESGRINDPSRNYPGDVCIRSLQDCSKWEKAIEVRDKPVADSDIYMFATRCITANVSDAAIVMVSNRQKKLDEQKLSAWSQEHFVSITLFYGWDDFVKQVLFWSESPTALVANQSIGSIYERLTAIEVSESAIDLWLRLTCMPTDKGE